MKVHPEHAEVLDLASGGTPIEFVPPAPTQDSNGERPRNKPRNRPSGGRDYRSGGSRGGGNPRSGNGGSGAGNGGQRGNGRSDYRKPQGAGRAQRSAR